MVLTLPVMILQFAAKISRLELPEQRNFQLRMLIGKQFKHRRDSINILKLSSNR